MSIKIVDISHRHQYEWILVHISLELHAGVPVLLTGHNGAGKTTLLRILAGILKPTRGHFEHHDAVSSAGLMTHQHYFYEMLTVEENLLLQANIAAIKTDEIDAILSRVGLQEKRYSAVHTLSAGMKRRLIMARFLLLKPTLWLLDEPFGQLDPQGVLLMEEIIEEALAQNIYLIIATHDIERGQKLCRTHYELNAGHLKKLTSLEPVADIGGICNNFSH